MIARNKESSRSVRNTIAYVRNEKKGGEVLLSSGVIPDATAEMQAFALEMLHNDKYEVMCHHLVISHGDEDSASIRNGTISRADEVQLLHEFLQNLEAEGVDLDSAPWMIARHDNTDNVHYHMVIANSCYDGSRFKDSQLGLRANIASAKVSLRHRLDVAQRSAEKIISHAQREDAAETPQHHEAHRRRNAHRRQRIDAANKRKADEERAKRESTGRAQKAQATQGRTEVVSDGNQRERAREEEHRSRGRIR